MTTPTNAGGAPQHTPFSFSLGPLSAWIGLGIAIIAAVWGLAVKPVEDRIARLEAESEKRQSIVAELQINSAQFSVHVQKLAEAVNKLADRIDDDQARKKD